MNAMNRPWLRLWILASTLPLFLAADTPKEAVDKVRKGLQHFRGSEFAEAETAFSEAKELAPENTTIIFDEACAARAGGDAEQARGLFHRATQATDPGITIRAHYNLGCLEADEARLKLGEDPAAAEGEVRTESISLLLASVRHYRDVLKFDSQHKDARHNLELIRLFIKHIQSQWAERDKQKARDEKNLLQFLKMIEDRQTLLRTVVKNISNEENSASKRKIVRDTSDAQETLLEEIEPLKQKITQEIQQSQAQQQQQAASGVPANAPDDQAQQFEQLLHQFSDRAGEGMQTASREMMAGNFENAVAAQEETLNQLNQIYMAVAPYQDLLQRSLKEQSELLGGEESSESAAQTETEETETETEEERDEQPNEETAVDSATEASAEEADVDVDVELSSDVQSKISDWSKMLTLRAEHELPQAKQQLEALQQAANANEPDEEEKPDEPAEDPEGANDAEKLTESPAANEQKEQQQQKAEADKPEPELTEEEKAAKDQLEQQQKQLKQMQGLVKSMELAMERGQDAEEHSRAAVDSFGEQKLQQAEQQQQETLRILKEIAEPLEDEQQDQDQQQQDQNQDQQNNDDQQNKDQQQQDGQQQQQNEDQKQQDQQKDQQQQPEPSQEQKEAEQKESKKQRAESILRMARDRERERREREKMLRAIISRGFKVEKDW